jgi:hypothetical protein
MMREMIFGKFREPLERNSLKRKPERASLQGLFSSFHLLQQNAERFVKISTADGKTLHRLNHDDETTKLPFKLVENFKRRV